MLAVDNRAADIRASTATTTIYDLYAAVPDRSSQLPLPLTLGSESRSDNDAPVRDMTTSSASDDHVLHAREEEPHSVPSSSARHATGASASASSSAISLSMHTQSVSGASASAPSSAQRASFTNKPSTSANGAHDSSSHAQQHLKRRDQRLSAPTHPMSSSVTVQSPGEDDEAFQVRSTCESCVGCPSYLSHRLIFDCSNYGVQTPAWKYLACMATATTMASSVRENDRMSTC